MTTDFNQSHYMKQRMLSKRECECLYWKSLAKTNTEIGMILQITARTVAAHVTNAKNKLGCLTLFQLGAAYVRHELGKEFGDDFTSS